jgi:thymidylate synthase (FAD)
MDKIEGLLDGNGWVSVELVSPEKPPHEDHTRDYIIAKAARASTGMGLKTVQEDKRLIKYLVKHHHTSPLEMANITFCIKCPIAIGRQFLRHRTGKFNEFSQRYSEVREEMDRYHLDKDPDSVRGQSKMNAQSSEYNLSEKDQEEIKKIIQDMETMQDKIYQGYQKLLDRGLTREVSRFYLPLSTYTVFFVQFDLNNLMKFLSLRCAPDAQKEIRVYADAMKILAKKYFPITMEAFEEEQEKMVLDKMAIKMIQEKKIPEVKSKSQKKTLQEISEILNLDL